MYDWILRKFVYLTLEEKFAKKYFAHLEPLPSIDELRRDVSLVLVNTHRAIFPPRPEMPSNQKCQDLSLNKFSKLIKCNSNFIQT